MPKTGKQIVRDMMAEQVVFGGMLFTRLGLLKELRERGYAAGFIDYHVYAPGTMFNQDLEHTWNTVPNEVPEWFWSDDDVPAGAMDELIAELISKRGPRNTEPGC